MTRHSSFWWKNYLHFTFSFQFTSKWICLKLEKDLKELCSFNIAQENLLESFNFKLYCNCLKLFQNILNYGSFYRFNLYHNYNDHTEYHCMNHSKLWIFKIFIPQLLYTEAWVISFLCNMVSCPCGKIYFICKELMFSFLPLS